MVSPSTNIPTIFAAFGATGDLMRRKVLPALFYSYQHGELPKMFKVVGFSRRGWADDEFPDYVKEVLEKHAKAKITEEGLTPFLSRFLNSNAGSLEIHRAMMISKRHSTSSIPNGASAPTSCSISLSLLNFMSSYSASSRARG